MLKFPPFKFKSLQVEKKIMYVKRNTVCYLSQRGHNNFIYPKRTQKAIVRDDCDVEKLHLITGGEPLTPVKIKVSDLIINKPHKEARSPHSDHTVVWLER